MSILLDLKEKLQQLYVGINDRFKVCIKWIQKSQTNSEIKLKNWKIPYIKTKTKNCRKMRKMNKEFEVFNISSHPLGGTEEWVQLNAKLFFPCKMYLI